MENQGESAEGHAEEGNHEENGGESPADLEARVAEADSGNRDDGENYTNKSSRIICLAGNEGNSGEFYSAKECSEEGKRPERKYSVKNESGKKSVAKLAAKSHCKNIERTFHGTGLIIEYVDPETGNVKEFLFEQRVYDNKDESQRGKYGLPGGGLEKANGILESDLENMVKEVGEEFENPLAVRILIEKLQYVGTITDDVNGEAANTFIYRARITSPHEWHIVANSRSADGAGPRYRVKAFDFEDGTLKPSDFMYSQGEFLFNYASSQGIKIPKTHRRDGHSNHSVHYVLNFNAFKTEQYAKPNNNISTYFPMTLQKAA